MDYTIRYIEYNGKRDDIVFDFPKEYELLSVFLSCEVSNFYEEIKKEIGSVLKGEVKKKTIAGNVCKAEIDREKTRITDMLTDAQEEQFCEIQTKELYELIEVWNEKNREFKAERL